MLSDSDDTQGKTDTTTVDCTDKTHAPLITDREREAQEPIEVDKSPEIEPFTDHFSGCYVCKHNSTSHTGTHNTIKYRSYNNFEEEAFLEDLTTTPWNIIDMFDNPNDALDRWKYLFLDVVGRHRCNYPHEIKIIIIIIIFIIIIITTPLDSPLHLDNHVLLAAYYLMSAPSDDALKHRSVEVCNLYYWSKTNPCATTYQCLVDRCKGTSCIDIPDVLPDLNELWSEGTSCNKLPDYKMLCWDRSYIKFHYGQPIVCGILIDDRVDDRMLTTLYGPNPYEAD